MKTKEADLTALSDELINDLQALITRHVARYEKPMIAEGLENTRQLAEKVTIEMVFRFSGMTTLLFTDEFNFKKMIEDMKRVAKIAHQEASEE